MADDFKVIQTTVIPQLTEVRFYDETVEKVRRGHPEVPILLPSIQSAAENAISNPTSVEKSYGNSYIFVDARTTNKSGDPMQVPVQAIGGTTSGRVRSVYFAEGTSENVIYRSDADE